MPPMTPNKPWKCHEDRLYDVCFFCRGKAGPQKITPPMKIYIKGKLPTFENHESIVVKRRELAGYSCVGQFTK